MPLSDKTQGCLRALAELMVAESDNSFKALREGIDRYGFKQAGIPASVRAPEGTDAVADQQTALDVPENQVKARGGAGGLLISGAEWARYRECLEALTDEPELEHLSHDEVDTYLWELLCDLWVNRERYRDGNKGRQRLRVFGRVVTKAHEPYEVMIPIQSLRLVDRPLEIAGVQFMQLRTESATAWG